MPQSYAISLRVAYKKAPSLMVVLCTGYTYIANKEGWGWGNMCQHPPWPEMGGRGFMLQYHKVMTRSSAPV